MNLRVLTQWPKPETKKQQQHNTKKYVNEQNYTYTKIRFFQLK